MIDPGCQAGGRVMFLFMLLRLYTVLYFLGHFLHPTMASLCTSLICLLNLLPLGLRQMGHGLVFGVRAGFWLLSLDALGVSC